MLLTRGRHIDHAFEDTSNELIAGFSDGGLSGRGLSGGAAETIEDRITQARWLWRCSSHIDDGGRHPWLTRLRFIREGLRYRDALRPFQWAAPNTPLGHALRARPQLLEVVIRPYQTVAWDTDQRLKMLRLHYDQVARLNWPQLQDPDAAVEIMPLDAVQPGLRLVLDQAIWFAYEGPLVLNLFQGEERIYSLAFALRNNGTQLEACVGAIQGRSLPDICSTYRELTRAGHGLRPRDLLIEMFQVVCEALGVEKITLVSESHRHHRHAYFGDAAEAMTANYDAIWADRGARQIDEATFELSLLPRRRNPEDISPRKRTQYRRRYDMLDRLSGEAKARIALHRPRPDSTLSRLQGARV